MMKARGETLDSKEALISSQMPTRHTPSISVRTYGSCCGSLVVRGCIGIELIGRDASLSGLLDQSLFDSFGPEMGLGVLGGLLGDLNGALLLQFGLAALYVLRRHGSEGVEEEGASLG